MNKKIKVLFLSAEIAPLAKVGGLGDVAGALPQELNKQKIDIAMCLPFYGLIDKNSFKISKKIESLKVVINNRQEKIKVFVTDLPGTTIPIYLIKHKYFDSQSIYSGPRVMLGKKYTRKVDDLKRFAFYTIASLEIVKALNFQPDIIHANDWHSALVGNFIKKDNFFKKTKTVFTIHNLANQGIAGRDIINYINLDPKNKNIKEDLRDGNINFMAQGILNSSAITTVSPNYAKEILTSYKGVGLNKILQRRKNDLYGILNGIDIKYFDPVNDPLVAKKYNAKNIIEKNVNKIALQKKFGFKPDKKIAVIGLVSRFVRQKGLDIVNEELFTSLKNDTMPCRFVFLGSGQKEYEKQLIRLAKKFPKMLSVQIGFDEKLAHLIYAGSDMFLMPSLFEPCGLGQLIAMRYGSIPVVRQTGGLADTVKGYRIEKNNYNNATGFKFRKLEVNILANTIINALNIYYQKPKTWQRLQQNGMKKDFSWRKSAKEYIKIYKKLIK